MPLLSFQLQFAGPVERGTKGQTVRKYRKNGRDPKPGDRLYFYTGLRTHNCRKLGEAICTRTTPIIIGSGLLHDEIILNGCELSASGKERFARDDGFPDAATMLGWFEWTHGFPFSGLVIYWEGLL